MKRHFPPWLIILCFFFYENHAYIDMAPPVDILISPPDVTPSSTTWNIKCGLPCTMKIHLTSYNFPGKCEYMKLIYDFQKGKNKICTNRDVNNILNREFEESELDMSLETGRRLNSTLHFIRGNVSIKPVDPNVKIMPIQWQESKYLPQNEQIFDTFAEDISSRRARSIGKRSVPTITAACKLIENGTHSILESPMYPGYSAGGTCSNYFTNMMPRSSAIELTNTDLKEGDFLAFHDVMGAIKLNGPLKTMKPFGYLWPSRFAFGNDKKLMTNSRFRIIYTHVQQPPPCGTVFNVEDNPIRIFHPKDDNGKMPSGLFCEIRITALAQSIIRMKFHYLKLGKKEAIQVNQNGPELTSSGVYRFDKWSRNTGSDIESSKNIISVFVFSKLDSENVGEFVIDASKKDF